MVITVLLVVGYMIFMLRPHLARIAEEAKRQSGMLSHVPHEMDVRQHVKSVFHRSTTRNAKEQKKQLQDSSMAGGDGKAPPGGS